MRLSDPQQRSDPLGPIRGRGRREFRRLFPTPGLSATAAVVGASGWQLSARELRDLSLSGLAVPVQWWEWRRVALDEPVTLTLALPQGEYALHGRALALRRVRGRRLVRTLAIALASDVGYGRAQPSLCSYLLQLADLTDAPYLKNNRVMSAGASR